MVCYWLRSSHLTPVSRFPRMDFTNSSLHGGKLNNFPQETVSMLKNTCSHRWNSFLCDCWTSYIFEAIMSTTAHLVSEQDSWSLSELNAPTQLKFQRRSTLKKTHWKRFTVAHFEVLFLTSWSQLGHQKNKIRVHPDDEVTNTGPEWMLWTRFEILCCVLKLFPAFGSTPVVKNNG